MQLGCGSDCDTVAIAVPGPPGRPGPPGSGSSVLGEVPAGTRDGVNTAFTVAHTPTTGTVSLYRNGLREHAGLGYTVIGTALTITTAPLADDDLLVDYLTGS